MVGKSSAKAAVEGIRLEPQLYIASPPFDQVRRKNWAYESGRLLSDNTTHAFDSERPDGICTSDDCLLITSRHPWDFDHCVPVGQS